MIQDWFDHTVTVQRFTETVNDYGEPIEDWTTHLENVPGRMIKLSGDKRFIGDKTTIFRTHQYICDVCDIKAGKDRILYNNEIYKIKDVTDPVELGHHLEVDLEFMK